MYDAGNIPTHAQDSAFPDISDTNSSVGVAGRVLVLRLLSEKQLCSECELLPESETEAVPPFLCISSGKVACMRGSVSNASKCITELTVSVLFLDVRLLFELSVGRGEEANV